MAYTWNLEGKGAVRRPLSNFLPHVRFSSYRDHQDCTPVTRKSLCHKPAHLIGIIQVIRKPLCVLNQHVILYNLW